MKKFSDGTKVRFLAFDLLSGEKESEGTVESEATRWIEANAEHPDEYAGVKKDEAYIIKK